MSSSQYTWRIVAGEVIVGLVVGGLLALGGGLLGWQIGSYSATGWGDLAGSVTGMFITYPFGVAVGSSWVGARFGGHGSFRRALLGSIGGVALALVLAVLLHLNVYPLVLGSVYCLLPTVLAALAQPRVPHEW